jgi:hypothetical protein
MKTWNSTLKSQLDLLVPNIKNSHQKNLFNCLLTIFSLFVFNIAVIKNIHLLLENLLVGSFRISYLYFLHVFFMYSLCFKVLIIMCKNAWVLFIFRKPPFLYYPLVPIYYYSNTQFILFLNFFKLLRVS